MSEEERFGDWIATYRGIRFWPFDPRPEEIDILDIAHALANICRWGGHCNHFISVAQHSVYVSQHVELHPHHSSYPPLTSAEKTMIRRWGLLHDASEAYLGDLPRPIKRQMPGYSKHEHKILYHIAKKFGLDLPEGADPNDPSVALYGSRIKKADNVVLAAERKQQTHYPEDTHGWETLPVPPKDLIIKPMAPANAKAFFLERYVELFDGKC